MLIICPRGESSLTDSISRLPRDMAKCIIFPLKINIEIEASKTHVQNASFQILHIQGAQSKAIGE